MKQVVWALAASGCMVVAAEAATVTVSIEDAGFITNSNAIETAAPGFGDDGPVDLDWDPLNATAKRLLNWLGGYSNRDAAWCSDGVGCALDLTVSAGYTLTFDSFFLGGFNNTARNIAWAVYDLADLGTSLDSGNPLVDGQTGLVESLGLSSTTGFRLLFGPDGFNGGINDITYSYDLTDPGVAPIPLPASALLLAGGLAGLAALRRRQTARA